MKVAEMTGGVTSTIRVRSISEPFDLLSREDEVSLVRSADQALLSKLNNVWAIEGPTAADKTELTDVLGCGLPIVSYVAQLGADGMLVLETRRFTQEIRIVEQMQLSLDEKVLDDVRKGHKVGGTVADVASWLEDRLFLPSAPEGPEELRRFVMSGDSRGRLDAFRIHGLKIAADVRRVGDKLRIERVVRGGRGSNTRMMLLYAPISIVDATISAEMNGAVRTTLSEIVAGANSYLRTWQEYHKLEKEHVLRRAKTFGALEYHDCKSRADGSWRFLLAPCDDLKNRLASFGDNSRIELEADVAQPDFEENFGSTSQKQPRNNQSFRAPIVNMELNKRILDLKTSDEDEEQKKPPKSGYLYISTGGDQARLRRQEHAEEALRTGNCGIPQLGLLMEGRPAPAARRGKISLRGPKLWPVICETFKPGIPTQRQLEAIEYALNTPDICLIQGPPGTGKTKVITAIQQCIAVLADEGVEASHRILVSAAQHEAVDNVAQRTDVFGLPAGRVGKRRRGADSTFDPVQAFADDRIEQLRARVGTPPEAERLIKARGIAVSCCRMNSLPADQAGRIRKLVLLLDDLLPPGLRDNALEQAAALERPSSLGDPEEAELMVKAARSIRVDDAPFSDDGPLQARKALHRLDAILLPEERTFLEHCVNIEPDQVPSWLDEGRKYKDNLLDRLTQVPSIAEPGLDEETQKVIIDMLDTVDRRIAATRSGEDAVLAEYLNDLESDPESVREALQHYTVVLASTLQHAASKEMRKLRGINEGQTTFESVIVDEAARANPLDLFIPLSMAKRRVVLVGDHRQLPHLLEPEVERQLAEGVEQGTVEEQTLASVKASLFERMWIKLRELEQKDSIRRTATLNAQYRMHPELGKFISREFYEIHDDGAIESPRVGNEFSHDLPGYIKNGIPCAAAWLDVPIDRGSELSGVSKSRRAEALAIAREVRRLIDHNPALTFGVIAFYSAQVNEIGLAMKAKEIGLTEKADNKQGWSIAEQWEKTYNSQGKSVERLRIGTVDAFQGREFDVVFLSITRSNDRPGITDKQQRSKYGHLMLENRLCVAMSRQQRVLVAVGDLDFVTTDVAAVPLRPLRAYADLCGGEYGIIR